MFLQIFGTGMNQSIVFYKKKIDPRYLNRVVLEQIGNTDEFHIVQGHRTYETANDVAVLLKELGLGDIVVSGDRIILTQPEIMFLLLLNYDCYWDNQT